MGCWDVGAPKDWALKLCGVGSRSPTRRRARLRAVSGHRHILGQVLDISRVFGRDSFILSLENGEMSPDSVGSVRMSPEN